MAEAQSEMSPVLAAAYEKAAAAATEQGQEEEEDEEDCSSRHCMLIVRFSTSTVSDLAIRLSLNRQRTTTAGAAITAGAGAGAATYSLSSTGSLEATPSPHPTLSANATANDLKLLIRSHLPTQISRNRLRLIHSGRLLPDGAPLKMSLGDVALGIDAGPPRDGSGRGSGNRRDMDIDTYAQDVVQLNELEIKRKGKEKRVEMTGGELEEQGMSTCAEPVASASSATRHIYIHCSIGHIPEISPGSSASQAQSDLSSTMLPSQQSQQLQGFDRLLAPNFTRDDVTNLRTQFRSLLSYTHTPDQMPSRTVQRALEERWLDGDSGSGSGSGSGGLATAATSAAAAAAAAEGGYDNRTAYSALGAGRHDLPHHTANPATPSIGNHHIAEPILHANHETYSTDINLSLIDTDMPDEFIDDNNNNHNNNNNNNTINNPDQDPESDTSLDDTLVGNILGFFWPVGALVWGLREENVWTRRRQVSVLTGVLLNLAFGFLKMTS